MPKNGQFGEFLKTCSLQSNSVTRLAKKFLTQVDEKCQQVTLEFAVKQRYQM